ncbi:unnamed protein product [Rhizophagus irregularis]|nr:unnamed protein product [Rhizophagus irregularis]
MQTVSHKLDDDGEGVDGGVRSIGIVLISYLFINYNHMFTVTEYSKQRFELRRIMKELAHFFGDSVLQSRTKSQPGSTNIFSQIGKFLYSIADIQSYIDRSLVVIIGLFIVEVKGKFTIKQNLLD